MPWKQQGGGGGGGPWGGGGGGGGQGPWGRGPGGPQTPDFEELLRKGQDRFKSVMPGGLGSGKVIIGLILLAIILWMASGIYSVKPEQQGVVLRFGAFDRTTEPGLNYHWPSPIETVMTPNVTTVNKAEIGIRSVAGARQLPPRDIPEESQMLTGDENIVDIDFIVQWFIVSAPDYLFNIRNPDATVKIVAESVMREVIGQTEIQSALTEGRGSIEDQTKIRLQKLLDDYGAGIAVQTVKLLKVDPPQPVIDAFIDVQRARSDLERLRNEAEAYRNDILPRARGAAERKLQEARAYKEQILSKAEGEAKRFTEVYEAYKVAKDVTIDRIYLETIEEVFTGMEKVIIDQGAGGGPGVVPYLPLPEIQKRAKSPSPNQEAGQ
jgi:modulator of FtsH protease HflK